MNAYTKDFDKNVELLEKCDEIQERVINSIKKRFNSETVYNEKHLKIKIKPYEGKHEHSFSQ